MGEQQTWVKYELVSDTVYVLEVGWCIGTYEILSKRANPAFWSSQLQD